MLTEVPLGIQARSLERRFHLQPLGFHQQWIFGLGNLDLPGPAYGYTRKRLGYKEVVPGP